MIIGLSGFARTGKDEAAKHLVENHGFVRLAFADKLRDFLYALNPIVGYEIAPDKDAPDVGVTGWMGHKAKVIEVRLKDVIDYHTWDGYKNSEWVAEIRPLLQRLGTEAGRQTMWDTIWIDATLKDLDPSVNYVVTDARFLNEFDAILRKAEELKTEGVIVRVERPGVGPANDHASELEALDYVGKFDYTVVNGGTIQEYHDKIEDIFADISETDKRVITPELFEGELPDTPEAQETFEEKGPE
jgi:hypothetical protein